MSEISIIIPILNEAETIIKLLNHLLENSSQKNIFEIIVVDGGSSDNSQTIVSSFFEKNKKTSNTKFAFVESSSGRAIQMNTGAGFASGSILYFLHADSFPPNNFDQYIIDEVKKGNQAGCFRLQFDDKHWWLRIASWLTQFRWRACRGGDQSQFITRQLFDEIGGFDESYTIYEDNILINELYSRNEFVVINRKLTTSARRYRKHGVWKLQFHFWTIYVKKWLGASADELYNYYKKYIA
jgi:rSAM/selenodomain-associated transferase 2